MNPEEARLTRGQLYAKALGVEHPLDAWVASLTATGPAPSVIHIPSWAIGYIEQVIDRRSLQGQ